MSNDSLGDRMKSYESVSKIAMVKKIPVIIRIDGRAFHTFCKRFEKPYDVFFNQCMNGVMFKLCSEIQGAKMGNRHSDEISILVTDYDKETTDSYFDYQVQKISSIVSSMATAELCRILSESAYTLAEHNLYDGKPMKLTWNESWPTFDCRCFNIPIHEVVNYFLWRQQDSLRNSLSMLAQSYFSHKELQGKNSSDMQEMLFSGFGINWNDVDQEKKTGFICLKKTLNIELENGLKCVRDKWFIEPAPKNRMDLQVVVDQIHNI